MNVDAEEEFDQCKAKVKVHEEAIADLDKYYKAIDTARRGQVSGQGNLAE